MSGALDGADGRIVLMVGESGRSTNSRSHETDGDDAGGDVAGGVLIVDLSGGGQRWVEGQSAWAGVVTV